MSVNRVSQPPNVVPNPSAREYADDWEQNVIEPLQKVWDHLHWLAVIRHKRTAGWFEDFIGSLLRMAYDHRGRLARGEE